MSNWDSTLVRQNQEPEDTAEWREFVGDRHAEDGDFSRAIGHYKRAVKLDPRSARVSRLADAYAASDMPEKALEQYQKALTMDAQNSEAHAGIGELCVRLAMSSAAVTAFERAVRCNPNRAYFRFKLAIALATIGRYERAADELTMACELSPHSAFYRFLLADVYIQLDRLEEAIEELERVVQLAPKDQYYHIRLGAARLRAGRFPEAIYSFEQSLRLEPNNLSYRRLLGYAYQLGGQFDRAQALLDDGNALDAYDQDYVRRVRRLAANGD